MDDQTRMAQFESMKKTPWRKTVSKNKKLFLKHKELEKMCAREIKRHQLDTKVATIEIQQKQMVIEKKQSRLRSEQDKCLLKQQKTQLFLEEQEQNHVRKQKVLTPHPEVVRAEDMEKAVKELQMPIHMRRNLMQYL